MTLLKCCMKVNNMRLLEDDVWHESGGMLWEAGCNSFQHLILVPLLLNKL